MAAALNGITVLDLGQVYMGPYCSMLLERLGADVIKIEPPRGDSVRSRAVGGTETAAFAMLNAGKRAICLDLKTEAGVDTLMELVKTADVLVENSAPGAMDRLGVGYETLSAINSRLIMASGRGYSEAGPNRTLKAMDVTVQAMSGLLSVTGFPDAAPVKSGAAVADFLGGSHLAAAVLAALFQRETSGTGQHVHVAMDEAVLPALTSNIAGLIDYDGVLPERTGNRHGGMAVVPYNVYPTTDGWVAILALTDRHWAALCELMQPGVPESTLSLKTASQRVERMQEVDDAVTAWTAVRPTVEVQALVQQAGLPSAPVRRLKEILDDAVAKRSSLLQRIPSGDGVQWALMSPLRLDDSPQAVPEFSPLLGEHTDEVLIELANGIGGTTFNENKEEAHD